MGSISARPWAQDPEQLRFELDEDAEGVGDEVADDALLLDLYPQQPVVDPRPTTATEGREGSGDQPRKNEVTGSMLAVKSGSCGGSR